MNDRTAHDLREIANGRNSGYMPKEPIKEQINSLIEFRQAVNFTSTFSIPSPNAF